MGYPSITTCRPSLHGCCTVLSLRSQFTQTYCILAIPLTFYLDLEKILNMSCTSYAGLRTQMYMSTVTTACLLSRKKLNQGLLVLLNTVAHQRIFRTSTFISEINCSSSVSACTSLSACSCFVFIFNITMKNVPVHLE